MRSRFVLNTVGGGTNQCADVVFSPSFGYTPLNINMSTTTSGAHIFYTVDLLGVGINPTHSGDNATGSTIRIGSNSGNKNITGGNTVVRALAYKNGLTDSNITQGNYQAPG